MNTLRIQHYDFAYLVMPLFALSNTSETFHKLNRNDRLDYLRSIWNGLGNKTKDHIPDQGLDCFKINLDPDIFLFVIQLPKPAIQPEAFFIGMLFCIEKNFLSLKATKARCFSLELSKDFETNHEVYVIGESVKGHSFSNIDHINYGSLKNKDKDSFINAIKSVLVGDSLTNPKSKSMSDVIHNSDSDANTDNDDSISLTEDDFEALWNKWTNFPYDNQTVALCQKAVLPLDDLLIGLGKLCLQVDIYKPDEAEKIGEWSSYALSRLSRGSFMVGLEYPYIRRDVEESQKEKVYQLLKLAAKAASGVLTLFLSKLAEHEAIPVKEVEEFAQTGGEIIKNGMIECFRIGKQHSPHNQYNGSNSANDRKQEVLSEQHSRVSPNQLTPDAEIMIMVERLRDNKTRASAIEDLISAGEKSVPIVQPLLRDLNPDVRLSALKVLSEIEKRKI